MREALSRWARRAACLVLVVGCGGSEEAPAGAPSPTEVENGAPIPPKGEAPAGQDAPPGVPPEVTTPPSRADRGEGDGKDVVALGDSYMRLPNLLQQPGNEGVDLSLAKRGRRYRTHAFTGGSAFPPKAVGVKNGVIPGQLAAARKEDANIKTVIVSGGGNDIEDGDGCRGAKTQAELGAQCKQKLDAINAAIDALIGEMAKAGVEDVVWVGYGPTPTSGDKVVEGAIDYLRADRKKKCVADDPALGLRCHYVDNAAANVPTRDGFHPTSEGYDAVAAAVLGRLKAEGARR